MIPVQPISESILYFTAYYRATHIACVLKRIGFWLIISGVPAMCYAGMSSLSERLLLMHVSRIPLTKVLYYKPKCDQFYFYSSAQLATSSNNIGIIAGQGLP